MRILLAFLFSILFFSIKAQVTFVIDSVPDYTPSNDPIYITGDFNRWHPGDDNYILHPNGDNLPEITLKGFSEGSTIEYLFTRGSWETVERGPEGEEIDNRSYTFGSHPTVHHKIHHWADLEDYASTAAWNVVVMDEEFYMPQLDRTRRIILYLPPDYHTSRKRYQVLYMHDAQNIFDKATAYDGEWEVDETLNALAAEGHTVPIVVGIDNNSQHRGEEYLPYYNPDYTGGQGFEYMAFIVETLKPHIDANYRTLPERENTGIMGSSLGGTISWYAALKYQDIFSKAGLFSPAYWANDEQIWDFLAETGYQHDVRFYQNVGDQESNEYFIPITQMEDSLYHAGFSNIKTSIIPGAVHTVPTWAGDFAQAYLWLFDTSTASPGQINPGLIIYPNPAKDLLKIQLDENETENINITLSNMAGKILLEQENYNDGIHLDALKPGLYMIRIETDQRSYTGRFIKL